MEHHSVVTTLNLLEFLHISTYFKTKFGHSVTYQNLTLQPFPLTKFLFPCKCQKLEPYCSCLFKYRFLVSSLKSKWLILRIYAGTQPHIEFLA